MGNRDASLLTEQRLPLHSSPHAFSSDSFSFLPCFEERSSCSQTVLVPVGSVGTGTLLLVSRLTIPWQQQGVEAGGGLVAAKLGGGLLVGEEVM